MPEAALGIEITPPFPFLLLFRFIRLLNFAFFTQKKITGTTKLDYWNRLESSAIIISLLNNCRNDIDVEIKLQSLTRY